MKPRQIITAHEPIVCEICRRTLLRGETPVGFIADGRTVKVCELCEPRAVHEGWIREGVADNTQVAVRRRDRKSLLRRFRGEAPSRRPVGSGAYDDARGGSGGDDRPAKSIPSTPRRDVHGVPTNVELKIERAIEMFNASGLPHRMAGITKSLGAPVVAVRPSATEGVIVRITIAWELAWYRFDVDLGDAEAGVKPVARGSELRELDESEMQPTNAMDEDGMIVAAA
ncbi:MAG: hypothetical protein Q7T55_25550 [Solirubrobacteraceae bacterium]|nr:hypothetical protein [Solirubrobacteraceae bacterium]